MAESKITVTEGAPHLKKVELIEGGRGGLQVTYSVRRTRNGVINPIDKKDKEKRPTQAELRDAFKELRVHLLKMCGYYWPNPKIEELLIKDTEVTYVQVNDNGQFQVGGKRKIFGKYTIAINGPIMSEVDYDETLYAQLENIVSVIKTESELFMKGLKGVTTKTIVLDYLIVKKEITNPDEAYASMSKEEIEAITKEALENSGLEIIMENGEQVVVPKEEKDVKVAAETKMVIADEINEEPPFVDSDAVDVPVLEDPADDMFHFEE